MLDEFTEWKSDRSSWERKNAAKQTTRASGDADKKPKSKSDKPKAETESPQTNTTSGTNLGSDPSVRTLEIPLRNGEAKIIVPRDLSIADVKKIAWGLMTYALDFNLEVPPRDQFPMLESSYRQQ